MTPLNKPLFSGNLAHLVAAATWDAETRDVLAVINELDRQAKVLRQRLAQRAHCAQVSDRTWEQWRMLGYAVRMGERHTGRNEYGIATFRPHQVVPVGGYTGANRKYPETFNQMDLYACGAFRDEYGSLD